MRGTPREVSLAEDVDAGSVEGDGGSIASFASIAEPAAHEAESLVLPHGADEVSRRYRVGPEIGAGAMGRVSLVRDRRLLRDVAWKLGDGRILREARVLAQLEHPGIVPIYDLGFDGEDRPFIAMRVVSGRSLARVIADTPRERRASLLRPLLQAAEAVAFAHHRGVVHRDLKPSNVMTGSFGETQVVDWGLARVLDDAAAPIPAEVRRALAGSEHHRVGTPGYMSPEQEAGRPADRRSDVYALGRMLGEIVGDPGHADAVAPELLAIVTRSIDDDPDERYPDAAAFAADLSRYLDGGRVQAHTYRPRELLRRFVRAYRVPLLVAAVALAALSVLLTRYIADIAQQRERAEGAETEARAALLRSDHFLSRALVGEARRLAAEGSRAEAELLAAHALTLGEDPEARAIVASYAGAPSVERVWRKASPCPDAQVDPRSGRVLCARFDGVSLWSVAGPRLERLWHVEAPLHVARLVEGGVVIGNPAEVWLLDLQGRVTLRATSPNNPGARAATLESLAVLEGNGVSILADPARGIVQGVSPCQGALHGALVPRIEEGTPGLAAALCKDGTLRIDGRVIPTALVAPEREGVRMATAGLERFVVGTNKGEVLILDHAGEIVRSSFIVAGMVRLLAPSPDGRLLLVAGEGDPIAIVTLPELARVASLPRRVRGATWDGDRPSEIVTTGAWIERWRFMTPPADRPLGGAYLVPLRDGVVSLEVDASVPGELAAAIGPHVGLLTPAGLGETSLGFVTVKAVTREGDVLTAAGAQGFAQLDAGSLDLRAALWSMSVRRMVTLSDGRSLVATYSSLLRREGERFEPIVEGPSVDLSVAPHRRFALLLRETDHALLRLSAHDPGVALVGYDPLARAVAIGSDGARLYGAHADEVVAWDDLGNIERVYFAADADLVDVEVSGDGRWIAAGGRGGEVFVWDAHAAAPRARFRDHRERVPGLAFSGDGRWLATGSWDRTIRFRGLDAMDAPAGSLRDTIEQRYALDLREALDGVTLGTGSGRDAVPIVPGR